MIEVYDEENEGETVLTNKFKALGNRKPTQQKDVKSTSNNELWKDHTLWTRHAEKNTYDAKSLGLKNWV